MSEKAVSSAVKQSLSLAELADPLMKELRDKLDGLFANEAMERFTHVLCTGCGDSYIAGVAATPAFHTLTDITVEVLPAEDLCYGYDFSALDTAHTLCIGISISGRVACTVAAMETARRHGIFTIGLTENPTSPIAQHVDYILKHNMPERDLAPGVSTYFTSTMALMLLAIRFSQQAGRCTAAQAESLCADIVGFCESYRPLIPSMTEQMEQASEAFATRSRFVTVGCGPDYATAWFARAKVIESIGRPAALYSPADWMDTMAPLKEAGETGVVLFLSENSAEKESCLAAARRSVEAGCPTVLCTDFAAQPLVPGACVVQLPAAGRSWVAPLMQFMPMTLLCGYMQTRLGEVTFRGITQGIWGESTRNRIYADVSRQIEVLSERAGIL